MQKSTYERDGGKMNVPCYGCEKRAVGCHSSCGDYKEFQVRNEKRKEAEHEASEYYNTMKSYRVDKYKRLTGRNNI